MACRHAASQVAHSASIRAHALMCMFASSLSSGFKWTALLRRSADNLNGLNRTQLGNTIWRAPLVWLMLNLLRFVLIAAFKPLFWLTVHLSWCGGF